MIESSDDSTHTQVMKFLSENIPEDYNTLKKSFIELAKLAGTLEHANNELKSQLELKNFTTKDKYSSRYMETTFSDKWKIALLLLIIAIIYTYYSRK